ncbi:MULTISPECIES: hypothetical protein [unclassified Kitasatospora]|uniref:hypothetical protein n=1 Tax=unclassified Kitasatospora TaxID=2633591 RepID=UPI00070A9533|nr:MULTISPECIES: hypothetical protein [unclassified Kitasatospora]KQV04450.1 hypothetical protein ASC99_13640 [Kitasatospora sp. Root107]KRB61019.1 hypothetical protein ASE03_11855 [Kitasatospora sp. Root187]
MPFAAVGLAPPRAPKAGPVPNSVPTLSPPVNPPVSQRRSHRARPRQPALLSRYLGYVGYFVGTGLISGAVVHHPLDPARYTVIGLAGAALFLVAALAAELRRPGRTSVGRLLLVLGSSLALSFGIGMLSGGLQHFEDFPARAAALIPSGLLLSFLAYTVKEADRPVRRILGLPGLVVLVAAVLAYGGLNRLAAGMAVPADGHSHSHGAEVEEHPASATPAATPSAVVPSAAPSVAPPVAPSVAPSPSKSGHFADGHQH